MHTDDDDHFGPRDKPSRAALDAGYETSDAPTPPAVIGLVVLVALMFIGFVGGEIFEEIFTATEVKTRPPPAPLAVREEVSGPKLQAHPEVELEAYVDSERQKLASYGWVDRSNGVVRIPIERAMDIVAKEGLPSWEPVTAKLPEGEAAGAEEADAPEAEAADDEGAEEADAPGDGEGAEGAAEPEAEAADGEGAEEASGSGEDPSPVTEGTPSDEEFTGTESIPE